LRGRGFAEKGFDDGRKNGEKKRTRARPSLIKKRKSCQKKRRGKGNVFRFGKGCDEKKSAYPGKGKSLPFVEEEKKKKIISQKKKNRGDGKRVTGNRARKGPSPPSKRGLFRGKGREIFLNRVRNKLKIKKRSLLRGTA